MEGNWSRSFRYWLLTLLVVIFALLAWYVRNAISPLVIAALIAYVLTPVVDFLNQRAKIPRGLSATIIILLGFGAIVSLPALMIPTLLAEVETLAADLEDIFLAIQAFLGRPIELLGFELHLEQLRPDLPQLFADSIASITENAFHILESTTVNFLWILVILVTIYYLLVDWAHLKNWTFQLIPEVYQPDAKHLYQEIKLVWRGYLRGNLALMGIVGVVFSIAWIAIGMPGALFLGLITGLLTIIPDLGPAIAVGLAVVVALFEGSNYLPISNLVFALLVVGVYIVLINIKNIWLRPRIFGRSVHMHDGVVFVAIIAAVILQGILGALIVIPVLASFGLLGRYIYHRLLGLPPFPELPQPIAAPSEKTPQNVSS
ncbi:MAG TPA: AI-2E family transporter [Anaerolineales bacterium]|nr:AI-2E family transporter [Anaerolineales bacterium]